MLSIYLFILGAGNVVVKPHYGMPKKASLTLIHPLMQICISMAILSAQTFSDSLVCRSAYNFYFETLNLL